MAREVKVYISGIEVDLFDPGDRSNGSVPIATTFQLDDIADLAKRKGAFTRVFVLPGTRKNQAVFGNLWDLAALDTVGARQLRPCIIEADGIVQVVGKIVLKSIEGRRTPTGYRVQVFGDNSDWFIDIRDRRLNEFDLGWMQWNEANVVDSWTQTAATATVTFPLIDWGVWKIPPNVRVKEILPCVFVKVLIERIFGSLILNLVSNFWDSAFADRLILVGCSDWVHHEKMIEFYSQDVEVTVDYTNPIIQYLPGFVVEYYSYAWIDCDQENSDPSSTHWRYAVFNDWQMGSASSWTAPGGSAGDNVNVSLSGEIIVQNDDPTYASDYEVRLIDHADTGFAGTVIASAQGVAAGGGTVTMSFEGVEITTGLTDRLGILVYCSGSAFVFYTNLFTIKAGTWVKGRKRPNILATQRFDIAQDALNEKLTWSGLIKGMTQVANLYWRTDVARGQVIVEPRDDFFDLSKIEEWEDKVDKNKLRKLRFLRELSRRQILSYKDDGVDEYVTALNEGQDVPLWGVRYTLPDQFKEGETAIKNEFFAATHHRVEPSLWMGANDIPIIPRIWNEATYDGDRPAENAQGFAPRLLYFRGMCPVSEGIFQFEGITRAGYPKAFTTDYNDDTGAHDDISLSFADVDVGQKVIRGLFRKYWLQHLATMRGATFLEDWFRLSPVDILQLDFSKLKYIEGANWVLSSVQNYKPQSEDSTQAMLIKLRQADQDDEDSTEDSTIHGYRNREGS